MKHEEGKRQHYADTTREEEATVFGLPASTALPVVGSFLVSFILYLFSFSSSHSATAPLPLFGIFLAVTAWTLTFVHGKPKGYGPDWVESKLARREWCSATTDKPEHPRRPPNAR